MATVPASAIRTARRSQLTEMGASIEEMLGSVLTILLAGTGVTREVVATAGDLRRLALAANREPDIPLMTGWRRSAFGEKLLRFRRGQAGLVIRDGDLSVVGLRAAKRRDDDD